MWFQIENVDRWREIYEKKPHFLEWNILQDDQPCKYVGLRMAATCFFAIQHNCVLCTNMDAPLK
jgi:hypothetical protein